MAKFKRRTAADRPSAARDDRVSCIQKIASLHRIFLFLVKTLLLVCGTCQLQGHAPTMCRENERTVVGLYPTCAFFFHIQDLVIKSDKGSEAAFLRLKHMSEVLVLLIVFMLLVYSLHLHVSVGWCPWVEESDITSGSF